jgi:hypothetical protein
MVRTTKEADETETLLRGMIAECGIMIRDQLRPAMDDQEDVYLKGHLVTNAVRLMQTGGSLAESIGRLRGNPAPEQRQRITVERVTTGAPLPSLSKPSQSSTEEEKLASAGERGALADAGAPRTRSRKRRNEGEGG